MNAGWLALVWNGFREARRNRVTVVVGAFALVLLFSTSLVMEVTVATFDRVLTDVGLGMMSLLLVFLTIFLSSGLISREIDRRTIFMIVSRPLSRMGYLLARLAGNMLTVAVLLIAMGVIFLVQVYVLRSPITSIQILAIGMLWFELLVVACVGVTLSTFSGPIVSGLVTTGFYLAGHLSSDIYRLAARSKSEVLQWLGKGVYYALPNLDRLNMRPNATYNQMPAWAEVGISLAHALSYCVILLMLAGFIFSRRDFR